MTKRRGKSTGRAGSVRIVGGEWRGRRLAVADVKGLRPSGDRCRETLFNWLQPRLRGARAADLFAGTGALGFEAVSRGAAAATLIERAPPVVALLRDAAAALDGDRVHVVEADALAWLAAQPPQSIDVAFVDPPFDSGLHADTLAALAGSGAMRRGGVVYVELPRAQTPPALPPGWTTVRDRVIGDVRMLLLEPG